MKLESPWGFKERLLFFGGAGSGKTTLSLSVVKYVPGKLWVVESDISAAWNRAIEVEYADWSGQIDVCEAYDWESFLTAFGRALTNADPEKDWIVLDSASPITYNWCQDWVLEQTMGTDLGGALVELRAKYNDPKDYQGNMLNILPWPIVKKEYSKLWRGVQRWKGHMIMTAQAKKIGYFERDDSQLQRIYGPVGAFPEGQDNVRHAMSTTLFLQNPRADRWTMTTVKDRNRPMMVDVQVDDFGVDYLMGVGGWVRAR